MAEDGVLLKSSFEIGIWYVIQKMIEILPENGKFKKLNNRQILSE